MKSYLLFKVLGEAGEPIHGGSGEWPLPAGDKPGMWVEAEGEPECCSRGLHLVVNPMRWWRPRARLFLAEADLTKPVSFDNSDKAAFKRARLVCEITREWPLLPMYPQLRVFLAAAARSHDKDADISWADLSGADLRGADLRGADLRGADLSGAYLRGADLSGAYLSGADLRRAYLSGADLRWADLSGADLRRAYRPEDPPAGWKSGPDGLLVPDKAVSPSTQKTTGRDG